MPLAGSNGTFLSRDTHIEGQREILDQPGQEGERSEKGQGRKVEEASTLELMRNDI